MQRGLLRVGLAACVVWLAGCFVVTPDHRNEVQARMDSGAMGSDGGDAGTDAGGGDHNLLVDRCADDTADYEVLRDSRSQFVVDTRGLVSRIGSCGTVAAPGNDGFLAVEVTAGDLWHFHVIPDPATLDQDRDPFLYLLRGSGGSCDTRACRYASNACLGTGDEHFAFVAPEDGIWYLGIDDANPGGGRYLVEPVRLLCGDGDKVHGEACDSTENCNSDCQEVLSETRGMEVEANDNPIEANFVEIPASNSVTVTGVIGGDACTYPDVYKFRVDDDNSMLTVEVLGTDGTPCSSAAETPFDLVLRNSAGEVRQPRMTHPMTGCSELRVSDLSAAAYFIYVEHDAPITDRPVPYQLRITVSL